MSLDVALYLSKEELYSGPFEVERISILRLDSLFDGSEHDWAICHRCGQWFDVPCLLPLGKD